jgi:protein KRI1
MSSSDSEDSVQIQIREREQESDDYVKPALLVEYEKGKFIDLIYCIHPYSFFLFFFFIFIYIEVAKENELLGSDAEDSEQDEEESMDESDEEEDEDAAMLTPAIDTQIFKTIAAIQSRNPDVYDSKKKFFTDDQFNASKKQWKEQQANLKSKGKKVTLKDYEREMLLKHGGYVNENDGGEGGDDQGLTHVEEQAQLKKAFQLAAQEHDSDDDDDNVDTILDNKKRSHDDEDEDDDDDENDGFLVKREKSSKEIDAEEDDYRQFLLNNLKVN